MHAVYLGTYSNRVTVISKALGRCDSHEYEQTAVMHNKFPETFH